MERDYAEQIKALRRCRIYSCSGCYLRENQSCKAQLRQDAADAIEELLKENDELENSGRVLMATFARAKEKMPQWISAEERLPEDQGDDARAARGGDYIHKVLAASVTPNYTVMDTAYLENGIWSLSKYTSWKQIIGAPVTHWMPLPDPPKEVE